MSVFRHYIQRLSKSRFWLSKWVVAAGLAASLFLVGLLLIVTRNLDFDTFLNYFALGLLLFVLVTLFYGIIAIHDVPYEIAKHRDHPHQDAIHAAGWVSLFTLHVLWPFLWIWAMLYRPDRGWGFKGSAKDGFLERNEEIEDLRRRVAELEKRTGQEPPMELLLILTYSAICVAIFKIFKIPVNKWTLPTAALGGIFLIGFILLVMNYNHPFTKNARIYFTTTPIIPDVKGRVVEVPVKPNELLKAGDILFRIDPQHYEFEVAQRRATLAEAEQNVSQLKAGFESALCGSRSGDRATRYDQEGVRSLQRGQQERTAGWARASVFDSRRGEPARRLPRGRRRHAGGNRPCRAGAHRLPVADRRRAHLGGAAARRALGRRIQSRADHGQIARPGFRDAARASTRHVRGAGALQARHGIRESRRSGIGGRLPAECLAESPTRR